MPFDVVKTRLDLQPCSGMGGGPIHAVRVFCQTGQQLMRQGGGPQALFVGLCPRLLQTLPSTVLYWMAVEACRRALTTHFDVEDNNSSRSCSQQQLAAPMHA